MNKEFSRDQLAIEIFAALIAKQYSSDQLPYLDFWLADNASYGNTKEILERYIRGSYKIADLFREIRLEVIS